MRWRPTSLHQPSELQQFSRQTLQSKVTRTAGFQPARAAMTMQAGCLRYEFKTTLRCRANSRGTFRFCTCWSSNRRRRCTIRRCLHNHRRRNPRRRSQPHRPVFRRRCRTDIAWSLCRYHPAGNRRLPRSAEWGNQETEANYTTFQHRRIRRTSHHTRSRKHQHTHRFPSSISPTARQEPLSVRQNRTKRRTRKSPDMTPTLRRAFS